MANFYAARYARALLDVLEGSQADLEAANRELGDFDEAWCGSVALRNVWLDPSFPARQKVDLLDKLNGRLGLSGPVRNFLAVILNHERIGGWAEILGEFRKLLRGDLAIDKVEWTSARALGEAERREVEARIHALTGRGVEATFREDPALLGGARLQIGSTVYDASVRGRLDALKETLAGG